MKKKLLSILMATAMMSTLMTGCGGEEAGGSDGDVTLKWAIWDQSTTQYWTDIKEAYEASHEGRKAH